MHGCHPAGPLPMNTRPAGVAGPQIRHHTPRLPPSLRPTSMWACSGPQRGCGPPEGCRRRCSGQWTLGHGQQQGRRPPPGPPAMAGDVRYGSEVGRVEARGTMVGPLAGCAGAEMGLGVLSCCCAPAAVAPPTQHITQKAGTLPHTRTHLGLPVAVLAENYAAVGGCWRQGHKCVAGPWPGPDGLRHRGPHHPSWAGPGRYGAGQRGRAGGRRAGGAAAGLVQRLNRCALQLPRKRKIQRKALRSKRTALGSVGPPQLVAANGPNQDNGSLKEGEMLARHNGKQTIIAAGARQDPRGGGKAGP